MENKTYKKYLLEQEAEIEGNANKIERILTLPSKTAFGDIAKFPLDVFAILASTIMYFGGRIVKHPMAAREYFKGDNQ